MTESQKNHRAPLDQPEIDALSDALKASRLAGQALSYNLPDGADMALVEYATDERPTPGLADDVAALRELVEVLPEAHRMLALARLDRIAAQMPQRATATGLNLPLWLHVTCGGTATGHTAPKLTVCRKCDVLTGSADWQALYVLGGGGA